MLNKDAIQTEKCDAPRIGEGPSPRKRGETDNLGGGHGFDRIVLDDRVGEQLFAHRLDLFTGAGRIGFGKVELDQLALTHLVDPAKAECRQRIADCFALRVELKPLRDGLSMIAAGDIDELATRRLELALPAFQAWPTPDPDYDDWSGWQSLLGSTRAPPNEPPDAAMRFRTDGYGTVSSAVIALPAGDGSDRRPVFRFAEWLPNPSPWRDVMDPDRG